VAVLGYTTPQKTTIEANSLRAGNSRPTSTDEIIDDSPPSLEVHEYIYESSTLFGEQLIHTSMQQGNADRLLLVAGPVSFH